MTPTYVIPYFGEVQDNGHRVTCDWNLYAPDPDSYAPDDRTCNLDCAEHTLAYALEMARARNFLSEWVDNLVRYDRELVLQHEPREFL